ncbi:geranylgeranylglyceryl/heptaprenylglyceryl phosphate synthase [Chitinophaga tropicalis]|uniref:Geranylgeranylglyceryl phosphate synthase n=1 Tax=Chitinophaga tropicalis TaxID=2683588 RepID=A0A7K1TXF4_9BACT|nr:geranylgeranylglyceryl/heptaprenylglyceryl phosphate synthase [Chitinophaga tropicalis]MVT06784.1 geranylgeranylglyceryl/heptaprenylglyceryl phosphate synthase [Chitinophaga tropicalis]
MHNKIYNSFIDRKAKGTKSFAVLIDPDKVTPVEIADLAAKCTAAKVDYIFLGGSLVITNHLDECVQQLKARCDIPVVLFPGSPSQVSRHADALLYLSVISGRNPELLIGQHVLSAPAVKKSGLEVISTGYMVIDGGAPTTVSYISNTTPIPADKDDIALCTAMAGEMLGMKVIFMDAGSGARKPITESMIARVASQISAPLIVGGGIRDAEKAYLNCKAGADVIVVGNAIEKETSLIKEIADAVHAAMPALK